METIVVESGLNDPMAIFLTVVFVSLVDSGGGALSWGLTQTFIQQLGIGALAGIFGGLVLAWLTKRLELPSGLFAVMALAGALALFGAVQLIGGSGYLAVYVCGVLLMHPLVGERRHELDVTHGSLAWLSQILMFLMLGLLVTPHQLTGEVVAAAGVALVLIFVARPVAVAIGLAPFRFTLKERVFIAWVGLRGAVPIFLAIIPVVKPGSHRRELLQRCLHGRDRLPRPAGLDHPLVGQAPGPGEQRRGASLSLDGPSRQSGHPLTPAARPVSDTQARQTTGPPTVRPCAWKGLLDAPRRSTPPRLLATVTATAAWVAGRQIWIHRDITRIS
jgi:hypothetical protein